MWEFLSNDFLCLLRWRCDFYPLLLWWIITLVGFQILNQPCIPRTHPTWPLYITLFICCCIWFGLPRILLISTLFNLLFLLWLPWSPFSYLYKNKVVREIFLKSVRSIAQSPVVSPLLRVGQKPFQCLPGPTRVVPWSSSPQLLFLSSHPFLGSSSPVQLAVHEQTRPAVILECLHTLPSDTHMITFFLPSLLHESYSSQHFNICCPSLHIRLLYLVLFLFSP